MIAGRFEKRMAGMIIRAGYHDAMSIDTACRKKTPGSIKCGGAGGMLLLPRHVLCLQRWCRWDAALCCHVASCGCSSATTAVAAATAPAGVGWRISTSTLGIYVTH